MKERCFVVTKWKIVYGSNTSVRLYGSNTDNRTMCGSNTDSKIVCDHHQSETSVITNTVQFERYRVYVEAFTMVRRFHDYVILRKVYLTSTLWKDWQIFSGDKQNKNDTFSVLNHLVTKFSSPRWLNKQTKKKQTNYYKITHYTYIYHC